MSLLPIDLKKDLMSIFDTCLLLFLSLPLSFPSLPFPQIFYSVTCVFLNRIPVPHATSI